jgi:Flp pilus assembly CpaE family ATPase
VDNVARIVLAMEQHDVAEEVMHFLDRSGQARVVATAADDRQLLEAIRQMEPDAVIAQPSLVSQDALGSRTFLAVDTRESIAALRAAIRSGASGFFIWPADRDALLSAAAAALAGPAILERRAIVVAVHAARGGAGATFIVTHLARAFARAGRSCVVIDGDPLSAEVGAAVGAPEDDVHTLADLVPLGSELTIEHLDETLWTHPAGFRVLLAPPPEHASAIEPVHLRRIIDLAATSSDVVLLHVGRTIDGLGRAGLETADRIVEVLSLDVVSFRGAKRDLDTLRPLGRSETVGFVVNRAARAEITPADVERVFGCEPLAVVPFDRSVSHAQDHGRLVSTRGRTSRAFERLVKRLEESVS